MISLNGKRIIVTGASSGIGRGIAYQASLLGASLILFGRNSERLKATYDSLVGDNHEYHITDLTDYLKVEKIIRHSVDSKGSIDGFVHSAGIEKTLPFKASKPDVFKDVFEINVFAGFELARLLSFKGIVNPLGASFIFISSINAIKSDPGKVIYCSSKSALLGGVKAVALELAPKNIRCNCVLPGIVETEMVKKLFNTISMASKQDIIKKHALGLGQVEDVSSLVCFLLSDNAKWITGSDYIIDGGYSA